jgi:hypothetical protein
MSVLNDADKLKLQDMISNSECEDNTEHIRKVKHSVILRDELRKLNTYMNFHRELQKNSPEEFLDGCRGASPFLYNNYTDIFNRVVKDELNMEIMTQLLMILKMIEDKKVDQHEGSVVVGKLLKQLYVDSALKRGENLDSENAAITEAPEEGKKISWKDFKNMKKTV